MRDALSRRRLLAGTAALASPVAAVPTLAASAVVAPSADLTLHMAARGAIAIRACVNLPGAFDDMPEEAAEAKLDRLCDVVDEQLDIVIATPATTLADLHDKALAVADEVRSFRPGVLDPDGGGDRTDHLLGLLIRDVLALTAEATHV